MKAIVQRRKIIKVEVIEEVSSLTLYAIPTNPTIGL
jgi:hypothetical protein